MLPPAFRRRWRAGITLSTDTGATVSDPGPTGNCGVYRRIVGKCACFSLPQYPVFYRYPDAGIREYSVEAAITGTDRLYKQTYAGRLVAEEGKIKLLRESLDTLAAWRAFNGDHPA